MRNLWRQVQLLDFEKIDLVVLFPNLQTFGRLRFRIKGGGIRPTHQVGMPVWSRRSCRRTQKKETLFSQAVYVCDGVGRAVHPFQELALWQGPL